MSQDNSNLNFNISTNNAAVPNSDYEFFSGNWSEHASEGQLAVDVAETEKDIVVITTLAGTNPAEIELHLQNDVLTIRGKRNEPLAGQRVSFFYQECYWGSFSRTIVLPTQVDKERVQAEFKNGLLVIVLPKAAPNGKIPIMVVEE